MKYRSVLFILTLALMFTLSVLAQEDVESHPLLIAAYGIDGGLYVFNLESTPILILESEMYRTPSVFTASPVWSPDGEYLAYQGDEIRLDLYLRATDELVVWKQITSLDYTSLLTFTMDSENLIYSNFGEGEPASNPPGMDRGTWIQVELLLEEYSIHGFTTQEVPTQTFPVVHEVAFRGRDDINFSCPSYGMAITESRETYLTPLILEDTPYGIVTVFNHPDQEDASRFEIGADIVETPFITRVAIASNRAQIVFKVDHDSPQVGTINLQTQQVELYELNHHPEAIISDGERYLYYSHRIEGNERIIPSDLSSPEIWYLSCNEHINQVAMYQFDMQTQEETLLYTGNYYAMPWMTLSPDGEDIYFTVIPNGEIWLEALLEDECVWQECEEHLFPDLYRLNTTSLQSELLLEDVLKPVINFGYRSQN